MLITSIRNLKGKQIVNMHIIIHFYIERNAISLKHLKKNCAKIDQLLKFWSSIQNVKYSSEEMIMRLQLKVKCLYWWYGCDCCFFCHFTWTTKNQIAFDYIYMMLDLPHWHDSTRWIQVKKIDQWLLNTKYYVKLTSFKSRSY